MNERSYKRELDKIIRNRGDRRPTVMLHSCCGPCSSSVLEFLTQYFDVTLLWYNPNLYPESEYEKRLTTQRELLEKMELTDKVRLIVEPWRNEEYEEAAKGLEKEPEGGKRCEKCFALRLKATAEAAAREGCDYFCTTLTVSRYKNTQLINSVGEETERLTGVKWLPSDFKKRGGEMRSKELSNKFGLYQQVYCGCRFSLYKRTPEETDEA